MNHHITIVPAQKMDTPTGLYRAVCSCGDYQSAPMGEKNARVAGAQHKSAKEAP